MAIKYIYISNYLKCQWAKCSDQNTQSCRLDNKTRAYNMLPIRDPLQGKAHTQIESEGMTKWAQQYSYQTKQTLKAARKKKQITYKGIPISLTADHLAEAQQARREWQDIFKAMKGENLQPGLLYQARISFRLDREIKTFTDKQKLRELSTTKSALQQMLKELLQEGNTRKGKDLQYQKQKN